MGKSLLPKENGRLGIREIGKFNATLLAI